MVIFFFGQPINNDIKTYENIRKIATGQGDDYAAGCLLDYPYVKENNKTIAIDLSKQQGLDADPRTIKQINVTVNLQSWPKYFRQTVVFLWNSTLREKFNFYFSRIFC